MGTVRCPLPSHTLRCRLPPVVPDSKSEQLIKISRGRSPLRGLCCKSRLTVCPRARRQADALQRLRSVVSATVRAPRKCENCVRRQTQEAGLNCPCRRPLSSVFVLHLSPSTSARGGPDTTPPAPCCAADISPLGTGRPPLARSPGGARISQQGGDGGRAGGPPPATPPPFGMALWGPHVRPTCGGGRRWPWTAATHVAGPLRAGGGG